MAEQNGGATQPAIPLRNRRPPSERVVQDVVVDDAHEHDRDQQADQGGDNYSRESIKNVTRSCEQPGRPPPCGQSRRRGRSHH